VHQQEGATPPSIEPGPAPIESDRELRPGVESVEDVPQADVLAARPEDSFLENDDRTPIMWHSNAPWVGSGYGTQTGLFGPLLDTQLGYDVAFSAFFGLQGARQGWVAPNGRPYVVYPSGRDGHGNDVLGAHTKHWFRGRGGYCILLTDPWVMQPKIIQRLPCLAWVPVDHDPIMPRTHHWFNESGAIAVAMSRFGQRILEEAGHEDVQYVPHGFNPRTFRPIDRGEARKALGLPQDAFVVGMVAANLGFPSRKSFSQAFQAFARLQENHNDCILYLHTWMENPDGEPLSDMCDGLKIRPWVADQYGLTLGIPDKVVAATLNAFDVLLNPSTGEGFGVPLLEAQACGTPCITTNFSSMPEVAPVEAGNWCVGGQPVYTPFESWQLTPSVEELVECLEEAYADDEQQRLRRRASTCAWASQEYLADEIVEKHWKPVLDWAAQEFVWRSRRMVRYSVGG